MENMGEWQERNLMINKLIQGRELARQLPLILNEHFSSTPETLKTLAQKIQASYENALSMLYCNTSLATEPKPSEVATTIPESPTPPSIGSAPWSKDYDFDFGEEIKDNSKKRKALTRWTELIRVQPGTALEGPHDDGFSWRKYGQKDILGSRYPRSYYRCTYRNSQNCWATKQVQRLDDDPTIFEITYRGRHTCPLASQAVPSSGPSENKDKATSSELSMTSGITCFSLTPSPGEVNCSVQENINFRNSEPKLTKVTKSAISTTNSPADGLDFSFPNESTILDDLLYS